MLFGDLAMGVDVEIGSLAVLDDRFCRSHKLVDNSKQCVQWDFLADGHRAVFVAVDQVARIRDE